MSFLLGLRLAVAGGREAWARLVLTVFGVGIGIGLLLLSLTLQSAVQGRAERSAWQHTSVESQGRPVPGTDPALWLVVTDYYGGEPMVRVYVAPLGLRPDVPPGLDRLPAPGEVAVSPALRRLLESTSDDQLDARYPGRVTATIGDAGLRDPDQLVAVIGRTPEQMREIRSSYEVRAVASTASDNAFVVFQRIIVAVAAIMLLVPVVVFVVMVTRIAAARREQRLAAIRLVGATRLQTAIAAASETALAALLGTALGYAGYRGGRYLLASTVTYEDVYFFPEDVFVPPGQLALVLAGVPLVSVLTTIAALHRIQVSPLGITKRVRPRTPSPWRALPVAFGLGGLLVSGPARRIVDDGTISQLQPIFTLSLLLGLVLVGPVACVWAGRALAKIARRAPTLMAARRIIADPQATFRAVSGVVLAGFVATFFSSTVTGQRAFRDANSEGLLRPGVVQIQVGLEPQEKLAPLLAEQSVTARWRGAGNIPEISCADLSRAINVTCPPTVRTEDGFDYPNYGQVADAGPDFATLPITTIWVFTDGTQAAEERVRTRAASVVPNAIINTQRDRLQREARIWDDVTGLVRVMTVFVLLVAACSLTVGAVGGLFERRRPFALLRASGVRLGELRRVMLVETAVPMVFTTLLGVGLGLAASWAEDRYNEDPQPWTPPGLDLVVIVGGGLLASLVITSLALPLLNSVTRHNAVRFE